MTDQRNDSGQGDGVLGDMNGGQSSGLQQDDQGFGDVANDELDGDDDENAEPGDDVETDDQDAVGGESGAGYGNHGGSE